ncbi:MAG: hypothetical protein OXC95_00810 [Dehalococcoidia bacterium]|nr:hypothetical protein [Dehalococcoidia bacterium]
MTTDDRLTAVEETQAKIVEVQDNTLALSERVVELIEETRRESQQTRRIWVAFARHHGWPEDLENLDNDQ